MNSYKSTFPFWEKLTVLQQDFLSERIRTEVFNKGKIIKDALQSCRGIMSVISGSLRVYCLSEEGREVTLYRVKQGDVCILSASCLMDSIVFDVLIEASEDTKVCIIPSDAAHKIEQENSALELFIYKTAVQKFSGVLITLQEILFLKTDIRLARFLYNEYQRQNTTILSLKQETIAAEIASVREVVSRTLKYMSEEDLIKTSRGKIEIIDLEALKSLKDGN